MIANLKVPALNTAFHFSLKNATYVGINVNVVMRTCQTVVVGRTRDDIDVVIFLTIPCSSP